MVLNLKESDKSKFQKLAKLPLFKALLILKTIQSKVNFPIVTVIVTAQINLNLNLNLNMSWELHANG